MTSFLTFALSQQPKMSGITSFIEISSFLDELSSNLVWKVKIKRKENCKHIYSSETNFLYYLLQTRKLDSDFSHFLAKSFTGHTERQVGVPLTFSWHMDRQLGAPTNN